MRIAYITPYQGPTLVKQRPIVRNRSMSNKVKIELIAAALHGKGHEVEVISHAEVVDPQWKFFPGFSEPELFHPRIPVHYASALPIRRVNGLWSCWRTLQLFKARHRAAPFEAAIIFNLRPPLVSCANYARGLGLPVILEYEDDVFVDVLGEPLHGALTGRRHRACARVVNTVDGGIAVSPFLLSRFPKKTPRIMLRGVVGDDILKGSQRTASQKENWVLFSGTHIHSNGVDRLIDGWAQAAIPGWQLHITGYGGLTEALREKAKGIESIHFHGLVSREELVRLMCGSKICVNPHALSRTPGNVFAFKIIEYLGSGAHVITTPMGQLEPELERGITYMPDNAPATIASTLARVIGEEKWTESVARRVQDAYSLGAVSESLDALLKRVARADSNSVINGKRRECVVESASLLKGTTLRHDPLLHD